MNNKGFTLIELIASITLILLLFTIAVPTSIRFVQNSNKKHCNSIVDEILTNADLYVLDHPNVYKNLKSTTLSFQTLYQNDYIEKEYDFKNGYVLVEGILKKNDVIDNSTTINIKRMIDNSEVDTATSEGYNKYELSKNICE